MSTGVILAAVLLYVAIGLVMLMWWLDNRNHTERLRSELEEARRHELRVVPAYKGVGDAYRAWKAEQR